jgi:hypothetical protein
LVGSTELSGDASGPVWIRLTHAANQLGLSRSSFLGLAEREGIVITERYGRRGVTAAQLDAYLERCRIAPGSYGPELVPYKGHNGPAQVRHVDLLDAVVAGLSCTDARLAQQVGLDARTVQRWRSNGVLNSYLPALRALLQATSNRRADGPDLAPVLPWGSRCRLEQARAGMGEEERQPHRAENRTFMLKTKLGARSWSAMLSRGRRRPRPASWGSGVFRSEGGAFNTTKGMSTIERVRNVVR